MMFPLPGPFRSSFDELLSAEGHGAVAKYVEAASFDEVPLYSRLAQLNFLEGLSFESQNEILVQAAVLHQLKIIEYAERHRPASFKDHLYLVSITGWSDGDGPETSAWTERTLVPNFWIGNMRAEAMRSFAVQSPTTPCAAQVSSALGNDPGLRLYEGWASRAGEPVLRRIYVKCPQAFDALRIR